MHMSASVTGSVHNASVKFLFCQHYLKLEFFVSCSSAEIDLRHNERKDACNTPTSTLLQVETNGFMVLVVLRSRSTFDAVLTDVIYNDNLRVVH